MKKEFTIEIKGKEWEEAQDQAFQKAVKTVKIDGFRKGKVPKDIFLKKYGKESLYLDAADRVLPKAYDKMLKEHKDDELVAQPDITLKSIDDKKVVFQFILITRPEVKLKKYKGLKVKKDKIEATKEEIDASIEHMREHYAEVVEKDGDAKEGDTVVIDFEGFKDGVPFEGGKGENYSLKLGSHSFIPGFEEQIVGMKKGEEKDLNLKFPDDYHAEDLKGQEVVFKVKVNEIKETIIPEINADFFEDLGMEGIDSLEALQKQVEENILARKEVEAENKYIDELLAAAGKNVEVEIPEAMIKDETDRMLKQYEEHLRMQGLTLEQFYQFTNSDEAALREQMREEAHNRVLYRLMLEEIVKEEKIEISDEEADEEASKLAERYQMKKDEFLNAFGGLDMIKYDLQMRKAIETLKEGK